RGSEAGPARSSPDRSRSPDAARATERAGGGAGRGTGGRRGEAVNHRCSRSMLCPRAGASGGGRQGERGGAGIRQEYWRTSFQAVVPSSAGGGIGIEP